MTVHDKAGLIIAWINNRHEHSCSALRAIILLVRLLITDCKKRLLSCLIDYIVEPAWLTYAMSLRPVLAIVCKLVAALSGSASVVANWKTKQPELVPRCHLVLVLETLFWRMDLPERARVVLVVCVVNIRRLYNKESTNKETSTC